MLLAGLGVITTTLPITNFTQTTAKSAVQQSQKSAPKEFPTPAEQAADPVSIVHEDFYSAGQNVDVKAENSTGDAAVAGSNVTISGSVKGYLMAAGANVNINAPIGNDLWAAGANVVVNAPIADNAMLAGSSIVVEQTGTIGNDARIAGSSVDVKGRVTRNLIIYAANAQISSEVGGNATVFAENLTLNPGAIVRGDLIVNSPNQPAISPQAQILGRFDYHQTESRQNSGSTIGGWFSSWFLTFLWITVLGIVAVWFSSFWTNRVAEMLKRESLKSLLVGLIAVLLIPIVFVLLLVTVAGLPLAIVIGAMSLVGFILSGVFVSYLLGDWLLNQLKRWQSSNVLKIVFGALIVTLVMSVPWIGGLAKLAVFLFGFGAFLLERRSFYLELRGQGLV